MLTPEFQSREGMVTVYDDKGRYLGCMGIEFWAWLLPRDHEMVMGNFDEARALRARVAALETEAEKERKRGEEQIDYAQTVEAKVAALEEAGELLAQAETVDEIDAALNRWRSLVGWHEVRKEST